MRKLSKLTSVVVQPRTKVLATFEVRRNRFSIGWCVAFVQQHLIYVVQRAQVPA